MMTFYKWKKDPDLSVSKPDLRKIRIKYEDKWDINWDNRDEINKILDITKKYFG